jgi:hypothetical protein
MKGKKKIASPGAAPAGKKLYFGPEVQVFMEEYANAKEPAEKARIYTEKILPSFDKLVENLIYIYGFSKNVDSIDEIKADCVCFLFENMHKFDGSKGTKAFSYFNVVARNWLIINSKRRQKEHSRCVSLDDPAGMSKFDQATVINNSMLPSPDDIVTDAVKRENILNIMKKIEKRLTENHEKTAMTALNAVFENANDIDFLTKRAVFFYIREIAGLDQKKLASAMSSIRSHYKDIIKENGGIIT